MPILNPYESAESARAIYEILSPNKILHELFPQSINDNIHLASGTKMTGKSGGRVLQFTAGFAMTARGKSMAHQDDEYINSKK